MVDNISKPFNFIANTYAKANEVNADFDTLYTGVNACINQVNTNTTSITNIGTSKADKNGSSSNTFSVADPVYGTDAVNKQSMMSAIGNSIDYIGGLTVSKDGNQTILVTAGSCYDSTHSTILKLDSDTTKQDTTLGASATYYVYIIGDDTGTSIDILISSSSSTPSLPTGYTKYRRIARFTTDASKYIDIIYNGGSSTPDATAVIMGALRSVNGYFLFSNGTILQWGRYDSVSSGTNTVTFNKPFTANNARVIAQPYENANNTFYSPVIKTVTTTNFTFYTTHDNMDGLMWIAIGY